MSRIAALLITLVTLAVAPAYATSPVSVPELDVGAGVAGIALLAGAAAILREKFFRK